MNGIGTLIETVTNKVEALANHLESRCRCSRGYKRTGACCDYRRNAAKLRASIANLGTNQKPVLDIVGIYIKPGAGNRTRIFATDLKRALDQMQSRAPTRV